MEFKKGKDRTTPISFDSLDSLIAPNSPLRLIDSFVEHLDLKSMGFDVELAATGSSPYHPSVLLKIFIYGYLNGERSSRKLEKWTKTNLELMWLVNGLSPDHNTISNFRKDNGAAIKKVFLAAVKLAIKFDLVGKKLVAGDGTFVRGQNSKKNNFNETKIDRQEKYIAKKISGYLKEMEELADLDEEKKS